MIFSMVQDEDRGRVDVEGKKAAWWEDTRSV